MSKRIHKTVFLSYRRTDQFAAHAVFKDLAANGFDVFIDYDGIPPGRFDKAILENIRSRGHFVVVLSPGSLDRCDEPGDWLRREIECALECERNVVPLLIHGFSFSAPQAQTKLTDGIAPLASYQSVVVPSTDYLDEALRRLRERYLAVPIEVETFEATSEAKKIAREQQTAASFASTSQPNETRTLGGPFDWRLLAVVAAVGGLLLGGPLLSLMSDRFGANASSGASRGTPVHFSGSGPVDIFAAPESAEVSPSPHAQASPSASAAGPAALPASRRKSPRPVSARASAAENASPASSEPVVFQILPDGSSRRVTSPVIPPDQPPIVFEIRPDQVPGRSADSK